MDSFYNGAEPEHEYVGMGHCLDCAMALVVALTEGRDKLKARLEEAERLLRLFVFRRGAKIICTSAQHGEAVVAGLEYFAPRQGRPRMAVGDAPRTSLPPPRKRARVGEPEEVLEQLQNLSNAVAEYIMALDKLMVGPSTGECGWRQAALVGKLAIAREDADACLAAAARDKE